MPYLLDKFLVWGSFLAFPFLILVCYGWNIGKVHWILSLVLIFFTVFFIYCRFVEPQMIVVVEESYQFEPSPHPGSLPTPWWGRPEGEGGPSTQVKLALISDQHLGNFKGRNFLFRTVEKINEQNPDLVLIAGDFIYNPDPTDLPTLFEELKKIKAPIYAVVGNHDALEPGDYSSDEVRAAIRSEAVSFIDNKKITLKFGDKELNIYGISDLDENKMNFSEIEKIKPEERAIILAHNPDVSHFLPNTNADLLLAGHTHGGQLRIPWIYKYIIPTNFGFNKGWYELNGMKIFVSSGIGEVLFPLRFLVPPEIVIIELSL